MLGCKKIPTYTYKCKVEKHTYIPIPNNKYSFYHTTAIYNDSLFLGVNLNRRNVIDVYDIINQKFCHEIVVNSPYLFDRITGIQVHNLDSIYFCQGSPASIFLANNKGQVLNIWDKKELKVIDPYYINLQNVTLNFSTFLAMHTPVLFEGNMYIPFDPSQKYKLGKNMERVGCYNLRKNQWNFFFANTKDLNVDIINRSYPLDLEQPYILKKDSIIIVTYPMDMTIYNYNATTGELISQKEYLSIYADKIAKPQRHSKLNNCQKIWNFRVQTAFFGPLYYHPKIKKFTRIFHHSQSLVNSKGNINDGTERCSSIQIFDENLNIVGETLYSNGALGVNSYLPLSDGLLIGKQTSIDNEEFLNLNQIIKIDTLTY